jgi:peptidyl-tRNA hydrolase
MLCERDISIYSITIKKVMGPITLYYHKRQYYMNLSGSSKEILCAFYAMDGRIISISLTVHD